MVCLAVWEYTRHPKLHKTQRCKTGVAVIHPVLSGNFSGSRAGAWSGLLSQAMWRSGSETKQWFSDKKVTNLTALVPSHLPLLTSLSAGASTKIFEGDFKLLDFSPTNNPAWRQGTSLPDTSRMLQDLMQWSEQYRASSVAPAVLPAFQKHLTGRLIFFNNKAEVQEAA